MADEFLKLPAADQREVINAAAPQLGILPAVAEKETFKTRQSECRVIGQTCQCS